MNKSIRLLVEGFFDDEIFNTDNDIKSDIEDIGRYYDYQLGDIFYQNKKPYAICCGEPKLFKDNKPRFCLFEDYNENTIFWCKYKKLIKELKYNKFNSFILNSFNDFQYIDEDGYENTQIIKNNYNINEFPVFEYCINQGNNVYLPAIDELLIMYLNKDKLGKYSLRNNYYWSSSLHSADLAYGINTNRGHVYHDFKYCTDYVCPFFHIV